ncbi:MAG: vapC4 [Parachlamydiales bacterium]|nr:vapC4 [Parachlamydiales bacterium]
MRPILMDTNAYVAFKRGDESVLEVIQFAEILAISPVVLGELLSGFECGNKTKKNREELQQFLQSSRVRLFSITSDTANFYCQVYASLKTKGKPIPSNDIWIAAQALENGCVLCSHNKHFKSIDGLISGTTLSELIIS